MFNLDVKMNPVRGGVDKLPKPHPTKKTEERRPVIFIFMATQEKQEPNCQETKKPTGSSLKYIRQKISIFFLLSFSGLRSPKILSIETPPF